MVEALHWSDILVVCLYFAILVIVILWNSCREKKRRKSVEGFFLAGKNMLWIQVGFSLFLSNVGTEHFIGLTGSGAKSGIAVVVFEFGAVPLLLLLGWLFLPVYMCSGVHTMPEFLQLRFGGNRLRVYLSLVCMLMYVVAKLSVAIANSIDQDERAPIGALSSWSTLFAIQNIVGIFAGSVFIQQALGWDINFSIIVIVITTAFYTIIGGLLTVMFTHTVQSLFMLGGAIWLSVLAYMKIGGLDALYTMYEMAVPSTYDPASNFTCGLPRDDAFHIFRDPLHSDLPWPGVIIRATLASLWNWCTSQLIVQHTLAAKNIGHARAATIMAGYLKILPLFLLIFPGMISRVLFPDEVACIDPDICQEVCDNRAGCSNIAFPKLVMALAPKGVRGLIVASMMSALMGSLTSVFNSAATLFTIDIWQNIRKHASERELLIIGRMFMLLLVGVSIAWIPLIKAAEGAQLFIYTQAVVGYVAPPLCAVFLLAVLVPRINEKGAFWGLVCGQIFGLTRFIFGFVLPEPECGEPDDRPFFLSHINFTYFSTLVLLVSTITTLAVSFCTKPQKTPITGLTFWSARQMFKDQQHQAALEGKLPMENIPKQEANTEMHKAEGCELIVDNGLSNTDDSTETKLEITCKYSNTAEIQGLVNKMVNNYKIKMVISRTGSIILNVNACILICVLVGFLAYFG